ncbi:MAG: hypothetical protein HY986_09605 [Candidatus Melainabacteria bacterium]|nr:hypothetical protein [Candidatus Melainabacteria bacterium]
MFDKLAQFLEARFGKKVADTVMAAGVIIYVWGVIIGFKGNFVIGLFSLMLMLPPLFLGLVSVFTLGNVNLAAIAGDWLFNTSAGMIVGVSFCTVALAIILWRFPTVINEWASSKIKIK